MNLKTKILQYFETHRDEMISGQFFADTFRASRTGVWKAIQSLLDEGHTIETIKNKGYIYTSRSDILSSVSISSYLKTPLPVFYFEKIDSTNNYLKRHIDEFSSDVLVVANTQTNGRGRLGRSFYSPKDTGIYLSLLRQIPSENFSTDFITVEASVAVSRAIEQLTGLSPNIKWVNDIFCFGKKIGGILTEGILNFETGKISQVIIGIGVNVKSTDFPEDLKSIATSLEVDSINRNQLIATIVNELYIVHDENRPSILEEYRARSNIIGKEVTFTLQNTTYQGRVQTIDEHARLIVNCDGKEIKLQTGEVSVRGNFYE